MSTSESPAFSRACLALAALAPSRQESLFRSMPEEQRQVLQADLRRFQALPEEQRARFQAAAAAEPKPAAPAVVASTLPAPPETLVRMLEHEHPVLLAMLLERVDPQEASRVFTLLSRRLRQDVARHIASQYRPRPWVADRLDAWLARSLENAPDLQVPGRLRRILSRCPEHVSEDVVESLKDESELESHAETSDNLLDLVRALGMDDAPTEEGVA